MFILDAEKFKQARITIALVIINVLLFIFFNTRFNYDIFLVLVQINYNIIYELEIYRLLTSMFVHADPIHLVSNMFALFIYGTFIETSYKRYQYLVIYFISGLMGSLFTLLLFPPDVISLGASGAIFGLIGASIYLVIRQGERFFLILALIYLAFFVFSSFAPGINLWAHLFGLGSGLILGYLFKRKKKKIYHY